MKNLSCNHSFVIYDMKLVCKKCFYHQLENRPLLWQMPNQIVKTLVDNKPLTIEIKIAA